MLYNFSIAPQSCALLPPPLPNNTASHQSQQVPLRSHHRHGQPDTENTMSTHVWLYSISFHLANITYYN